MLSDLFKKNGEISKEMLAGMVGSSPKILEIFEKEYQEASLAETTDDFFSLNAKQAAGMHKPQGTSTTGLHDIIGRIVDELCAMTPVWCLENGQISIKDARPFDGEPVTKEEILGLPEALRPDLTGTLMRKEVNEPSYKTLLYMYKRSMEGRTEKERKDAYNLFRQGLEILDVDGITYQIIETNPNSMGYWLPRMAPAALAQDFFKVPDTKVIKVPPSMLQLTRLDYMSLTKTTLDIVDQLCSRVFALDEEKDYFIKTGVWSSKFDFRNAYVHGGKEVRELGEYLLFIHHQACQMASPLNNVSIYGPGTTNEWVVREFIHDTEGNPSIYKGLPLHTEYRVFVDFDGGEVLGMAPYWDPATMKKRFGKGSSQGNIHDKHDYVTYRAHEKVLMGRYLKNKGLVERKVKEMLPLATGIGGQWSIDIMQDGNDFWLIDMALAANSALSGCIPKGKLKPIKENWLPEHIEIAASGRDKRQGGYF